MKKTPRISLLLTALFTSLCLFISLPAISATSTVSLTVGGSSGPIAATTGNPVVFDVTVDCGSASSTDLVVVSGTVQPKGGDTSEIAWDIRNDSGSTIRINKFGVSWNCLNDPGNVCSDWYFDYVKFLEPPVNNPNKLFDAAGSSDPFPLTTFDRDVGQDANAHPYLDILADATIPIEEMEFVDSGGNKIENIQSGTSIEFTVTWGDTNGNTYTQIFTLTW